MNKYIKKVGVVFLLLATTVLLFVSCTSSNSTSSTVDSSWSDVSQNKVLNVGVDINNYPLTYLLNDKVVGFDANIATEVAKRLNLEINFVQIDDLNLVNELNSGTIDCYWSGLSYTSDINTKTTVSQPYMNINYILATKDDSQITNLGYLEGAKMGVVVNSSGANALNNAQTLKNSLEKVLLYNNCEDLIKEVLAKNLDVAIITDMAFNHHNLNQISDYTKLDYLTSDGYDAEILASESFVIAYKRDSFALKNKVEETIEGIVRDGFFSKKSNEWFGQDVSILN